MNQRREELPPIKFRELADALLAQVDTLVPAWLHGGHRSVNEWICGGLSGGAGRSCSVNMVTGKWADFSSDEKGNDLLGLYAAIHNLSSGKAAVQVARELGLESVAGLVKAASGATIAPVANPRPAPPPKPRTDKEEWSTVQPVPDHAPAATFKHFSRKAEDILHTATYSLDGKLYGYAVRFRTSDGGKETLPYTFCQSGRDGSQKWHYKTWDEPRPLFLPDGKSPLGRTVILVEGEVKAEVLQALLDTVMPGIYCVASWVGGCKAWKKADWSWLEGCTVLLWPDCDAQREALTKAERDQVKDDEAAKAVLQATKPLLPEAKQPGMQAQLGIGALLRDTQGCTVQLLPIPKPGEKVSGWDCKDAIETEGWTGDDVIAFLGKAQPLPKEGEEPESEPAQAQAGAAAAQGGEKPAKKKRTAAVEPDDGDEDGTPPPEGTPWWLMGNWDRQKKRWLVSRKTVIAALHNDEDLCGVVAFNELTNTVQARKPWPWPYSTPGEIKSADGLLLGNYLSEKYRLPALSKASLEEAIQTVSFVERFHPIREWLEGLEWDKKPRLDKWLVHALGESNTSINAKLFDYMGLVGRYWVLGMVYRVMEPGCKFDYCPVLEGTGGLRKSTLVEVLAGKAYFSDTPFDMSRGKEAQEQVQGIWGYEIAELSALGKADVNAIKAFISSKVDRYRVAYGTTVESFARQCVLVGTTNDDQYLRDRTGNRRFWPVPVKHQIDTDWVVKYRAQLFAEAYARYQQREAYTPTAEQEKLLFAPMQDSRLIETAVESRLMQLLTRDRKHAGFTLANGMTGLSADTDFVRMDQLVVELGADVAKSGAALESQIRAWLKQHGWRHGKKQQQGVRASGYSRPAVWPPTAVQPGLDQLDDEPAAPAPEAGAAAVSVGDQPPAAVAGGDNAPF